jgi:hypothetical protein
MITKVFSTLILSVTLILISCQYESQPTQNPSDLELQSFNKPKGEKGEWITFVGDLVGAQEVIGCCPNAGPFPEYTMTLSGDLPPGTYDGHIFMNVFIVGKGKNREKLYIVQFWTNSLSLEVIGGVIQEDKKTKITTVTFKNEPCYINDNTTPVYVSFTLTRKWL